MLEAASPKMFEAASPRKLGLACTLLIDVTSRKMGSDQIFTSPLAEPESTHWPLGCSSNVVIAVSCAFETVCSTRRCRMSKTLIEPPSPPEIRSW